MAYDVTCTINGVSSTAYRYGGTTYGTPGRVEKTSNNVYRIAFDFSFSLYTSHPIYWITDGSVTNVNLISFDKSAWYDASDEAVDTMGSVVFELTILNATYIDILNNGFVIDGEDADVVFNGSIASDAMSYRWSIYTPTVASISSPSNLRVNGEISSTGQTAQLTWTRAVLVNASGQVTHHIVINGSEYATTTSYSYLLSEEITSRLETAEIYIYATGGGLTSSKSNSVVFVYSPFPTTAGKTVM